MSKRLSWRIRFLFLTLVCTLRVCHRYFSVRIRHQGLPKKRKLFLKIYTSGFFLESSYKCKPLKVTDNFRKITSSLNAVWANVSDNRWLEFYHQQCADVYTCLFVFFLEELSLFLCYSAAPIGLSGAGVVSMSRLDEIWNQTHNNMKHK